MFHEGRSALAKTANSSPDPDRVNYRLLKLIKDTPPGTAVISDTAVSCERGRTPDRWRDLQMVMIPKPGKPAQKVIASHLQLEHELFHHLQYGS